MKLKDIMTTDVEYCQTTSDVIEAAAMMKDCNVGSIPLCENDRVVGMVSIGDLAVEGLSHSETGEALTQISRH
jgi:CBS domain-containing protein